MSRCIPILLLLLSVVCSLSVMANPNKTYTCPPCACIKDGEVFEKPGVCEHCNMRLITMSAYEERIAEGMTAVLIFDGMELLDMAGPWEVLAKQSSLKLFTVSVDGKPINTMGLKMVPDHSLETAPDFQYLVVPGGNVDATAKDRKLNAWLRAKAPGCKQVLSICTGAFILAEAGLLDGKEATTYHSALDGLEESYTDIKVRRDLRYVDNGQIITSAGISAGTDAAFYMVEKLFGRGQAETTALRIEYDWNPDPEYVRARFADMAMPSIRLPDAAKFQWLRNTGNEQEWTKSGTVSGDMDHSEVRDAVLASFKRDGWVVSAEEKPLEEDGWQDGKVVSLKGEGFTGTFAYAPLADKRMKMRITIAKL